MKKLLTSLAAIALAATSFVAPANAADFRAVGNADRGYDGTTLYIRSLDSGREYTFYGTERRCPDGRVRNRYNHMSFVMNGNPFTANVSDCGGGMVFVCAGDDYGNYGCSGYAKRFQGRYY